ncbi:MAG: hypothetical protein AM326_11495 [Candidatus Thorarchaeota archaeon SMTZ-45]|nr:MAG: hypothetical protein AM326_11495 [Candidatus Thorarchaeota archaeon SMTZ-45]KXH74473.1 MAG: hypothetical protein AM325_05720 [Candidatus Thorarchaeota archaeon SMTZ1-45]
MAIVSIVKDKNIRIAILRVIHHIGGMESFVQSGDKVVIKPNLVFGLPPFTGFTTDYPTVQAILQLCQRMNPSEIIIAEGSGGIDTKLAFRISGYIELAEKYGAKLIDLNESPAANVPVPSGHTIQELHVPQIILDCDVLINVPKLKLYRRVPGKSDWASLAVKNLMGALPGKGDYSDDRPSGFCLQLSKEFWSTKGKYYHPTYQQWWSPSGEKRRIHTNLAQGLVDINTVIKPTLSIIDAIVVSYDVDMTNTIGQEPFNLNTILASQDPLALDCIATRIAELDPFNISYLKLAAERGIGESDYSNIRILGTPLARIIKAWKEGLATRVYPEES